MEAALRTSLRKFPTLILYLETLRRNKTTTPCAKVRISKTIIREVRSNSMARRGSSEARVKKNNKITRILMVSEANIKKPLSEIEMELSTLFTPTDSRLSLQTINLRTSPVELKRQPVKRITVLAQDSKVLSPKCLLRNLWPANVQKRRNNMKKSGNSRTITSKKGQTITTTRAIVTGTGGLIMATHLTHHLRIGSLPRRVTQRPTSTSSAELFGSSSGTAFLSLFTNLWFPRGANETTQRKSIVTTCNRHATNRCTKPTSKETGQICTREWLSKILKEAGSLSQPCHRTATG